MKVIGLTGGIGAGKSTIGALMEENFSVRLLMADQIGHLSMMPKESAYDEIVALFGKEILKRDGQIDREKLGKIVFSDKDKLQQLNQIVHPWVRNYVSKEIEKEKRQGNYLYFVIESAILFESGFDDLCQEVWYIDASEEIRRKRLKESRGYTDARIDSILSNQKKCSNYQKKVFQTIQNDEEIEKVLLQLKKLL